MLAKCANPKCTAQLRYLHEGRLFVTQPQNTAVALQSRIEYRWLCQRCCQAMAITEGGHLMFFQAGGFRQPSPRACAS
jgi:hypothetical protein